MSTTAANPQLPSGAIPPYVPPHLQGKVWDFKNEDDGTVSFLHPEAALGLSPADSRVKLDKTTYENTFDRQQRLGNFTGAMRGQYAPLERMPETPGQFINGWIADKLRGAYNWGTSSQGKSVGTAGLLAALAGAAGGTYWGLRSGSPLKKALMLSLLAGAAGAGTMALSQRGHQKREAWLSKHASAMDVATGIIRVLEDDPSLSSYDRAKILEAVVKMRQPERSELYYLLRTSAGAGAGMLAMRFLGAKGLLPMALGGILGGLLGSRRPGPEYNAQGQLSLTNFI